MQLLVTPLFPHADGQTYVAGNHGNLRNYFEAMGVEMANDGQARKLRFVQSDASS